MCSNPRFGHMEVEDQCHWLSYPKPAAYGPSGLDSPHPKILWGQSLRAPRSSDKTSNEISKVSLSSAFSGAPGKQGVSKASSCFGTSSRFPDVSCCRSGRVFSLMVVVWEVSGDQLAERKPSFGVPKRVNSVGRVSPPFLSTG